MMYNIHGLVAMALACFSAVDAFGLGGASGAVCRAASAQKVNYNAARAATAAYG